MPGHHDETPNGSTPWTRFLTISVRALLLILILLFLTPITQWRIAARDAVSVFAQAGWDFHTVRRFDPDFRAAFEAKPYLPEDARYSLSLRQHTWSTTRARYVLYPITEETKNWDYFIDVTGAIAAPEPGWNELKLPSGVMVYARNGKQFLDPPLPPYRSPGLPLPLAVFAALSASYLLSGAALLRILRISSGFAGRAWWWSMAYLCGFFLVTATVWLALILGMKFTASAALFVLVLMAALAFAVVLGSRRLPQEAFSTEPAHLPRASWRCRLAAAFAVYLLVLYITPVALQPVWGFDAMSHWIYKAKALVHHGDFSYLADTHVNEYPLAWTLNAALLFVLGGGFHDEMVHWTVVAFLLALAAQLHAVFRRSGCAPASAFVFMSAFFLIFHEISLQKAYAETAFVAFLSAVLAALLYALQQFSWRAALLLFICGCGLAATKTEGAVSLLILAIALGLSHARALPSRRLLALAAALLLPIGLTVGWNLCVAYMGYGDQYHLREPLTLDRVTLLINRLAESVQDKGLGWRMGAGIALVVLFAPRLKWQRWDLLLALAALAHLVFIGAGLVGWKTAHIDSQTLTATPRLALHAAPILMLLLASRVNALLQPGAQDFTK